VKPIARTVMVKKVLRATQSPTNSERWCCDLECGHEVWVTRQRRPKEAGCGECVRKKEET
jgi:hypothetical protein